MVASKFTDAAKPNPAVNFPACAETCFQGAKMGMSNAQVASNIAAMNGLPVTERQLS